MGLITMALCPRTACARFKRGVAWNMRALLLLFEIGLNGRLQIYKHLYLIVLINFAISFNTLHNSIG